MTSLRHREGETFKRLITLTPSGVIAPLCVNTGTTATDLPLDVDGGDAARLLLHLLHPLLGQVEVGLQVVASQQQANHTQSHDDPQTHAVEGLTGHPEREREREREGRQDTRSARAAQDSLSWLGIQLLAKAQTGTGVVN